MNDAEPTVFLVDDDPAILTSLTRALGERGFRVEAFSSAKAFLDTYDCTAPGCLILDQGMPHMTGLELQTELANGGTALPIIFISGHGDVPQSAQAFRAGAIDFLQKPFRQEVLVERIQEALSLDAETRGNTVVQNEALKRFQGLTEREREIASLIVSAPSNSASKDLARVLGISPKTVEHHRARVLEKMDVRSVAELVELSFKAKLPTE